MSPNVSYGSVMLKLSVGYVAQGQTCRCKAVRHCKLGYEYGYYVQEADGRRVYIRVGISRTYPSAMRWMEKVV